ncbi:MAG: hypothetical protein P8N28_01305 [Phycisphaerales bacterium]|nr:hypothetical protein [Phycisphaerales bacterium]
MRLEHVSDCHFFSSPDGPIRAGGATLAVEAALSRLHRQLLAAEATGAGWSSGLGISGSEAGRRRLDGLIAKPVNVAQSGSPSRTERTVSGEGGVRQRSPRSDWESDVVNEKGPTRSCVDPKEVQE